MYCLMHSMAAVVHCREHKPVYPLGGITAGTNSASCCFMRLIVIRSVHASTKVLPLAELRSCAFG